MIPSVLSSQLRRGVEDFLATTFPITNPFFAGALEDLLRKSRGVFQGPYVSVKLPFLKGVTGKRFFAEVIPEDFEPHRHQEIAFERLATLAGLSTLIATGTGSGKTECFLYPILDHCVRNRGKKGIKAILIYPMNALATDQAKRLAQAIDASEYLRSYVTAGLLIGGLQAESSKVMGEDRLITDRDTMRRAPPDILLTNYRMLDYLLVRPTDFGLWKDNEPETLRYLVVDELHTFDGAQAADLACLIRRLKERLKTPPAHLISVGTSATLGGGEAGFRSEDLLGYARQVFGERFEDDSIVGEFVQSPEEFLRGRLVTRFQFPETERVDVLDSVHYKSVEDYVRAQYRIWFDEELGDDANDAWREELSARLKGHGFFRNLLSVLDGRALGFDHLLEALRPGVPGADGATPEYLARLLESFLALLSEARVRAGSRLVPLVQVRYQLWLRELRRMVGTVPAEGRPELAFADDLKSEELRRSLPVIHCRECGLTGWGGTMRDADEKVLPDLRLFYAKFFGHSPQTVFLFPGELASDAQLEIRTFLCTHCLRLEWADQASRCRSCGADAGAQLAVWAPDTNRRRKEKGGVKGPLVGTHDCPSCGGYNSLTILGSRAASLTSVIVAQLFSSPFNDDKKLLAFSDSVQDASHRAGFFAARTFRFTLRAAIQRVVDEAMGPIPFSDLLGRFLERWRLSPSDPKFLTTFLAPDMDWLEEYEELRDKGTLPKDARLPKQVERRLDWEIWSEYTFNCRIGRTLEKTGASVLEPTTSIFERAVERMLPRLREHVGSLRELDAERLTRFLEGLIVQLKSKGAADQAEIGPYLDSLGNSFLLGKGRKQVHRPNFSPGSRAPVFITSRPSGRFQTFVRSGDATTPTWFEDWLRKCFAPIDGNVGAFAGEIYELVVKGLVAEGVFFERPVKGSLVWGLEPRVFQVTTQVARLRCGACQFSLSTSRGRREKLLGAPCLRYRCEGKLEEEPESQDYYRRLYQSGDVQRIFATEHTGLLDRKTREAIEEGFLRQSRAGDPNLLSCTPTLEMGINIGDLSTLALCSVPPKPSNYLQRVGRAGRVDGNSLVLAIANARAHDLFFYFEPEEMIQGQVEPPGCFLNASAVLERQFTGFAFDRWVETGLPDGALPDRLAPVLDTVARGEEKAESFPWSFLRFYDLHRTELEESFLSLFQEDIEDYARERIREFARGEGDGKGLVYRIREGLHEVGLQRKSQRNRIRRLTKKISELEADPAKGKHHESEVFELQQEKAALNALVHSINERHVLEFMTTEGLLPNYAFPEAGVVLRSVIYRREEGDSSSGGFESRVYKYERPAAAAIRELAPANSFYAQGRKLVVDQVNLDLSDLEPWRFCASCTYMAREGETEPFKTCPRCGSALWADEGQRKMMLRMREVISTSSERKSRSHDESEDRDPHFYQKNMFVLKDDDDVTSAFGVEENEVPFGFEFFRKMTLREVNFGEAEGSSTTTIANREIVDNPFKLCRRCGKVQGVRKPLDHAPYCSYRGSETKAKVFEASYLYREVTSEAIRMLLPVATFEVERYVESFVAGLDLGLRKKFRGDPGHLLTTVYDEPMAGSDVRKRFLVLYDGVPGGTGYLKELMQSPDILMDVFQLAYDVMATCSCQKDEQKDGCYRCLFAYRGGHDRDNTSRAKAMELFDAILRRRDKMRVIDRIDQIRLNSLLESELEGRFIEALWRPQGLEPASSRQLKHAVVRGKQGWHFKLAEASYLIEPQVELGTTDGVSIPCRADFVFHPERPQPGELPIVVFTDGYEFHADPESQTRLGLDTAQRQAILRSGRFRVWSVTWDDVQDVFEPGGEPAGFGARPEALKKLIENVDPTHAPDWIDVSGRSSFELLLSLLGRGRARDWRTFGQCYAGALLSKQSASLDEIKGLRFIYWDVSQANPGAWEGEGKDWVCGVHSGGSGSLGGFAAGESVRLRNGGLEEIGGIFRLYDEGVACERSVWKSAWRSYLRLMNVLQFTGTFEFVASNGLRKDLYANVLAEAWYERRRAPEDVPKEVQAVLDVVDPSVHGLVLAVARAGEELPEAGYELEDDQGEIVAQAELGWEEVKIAVFLRDQESDHGRFQSAGFRSFFADEFADDPGKLVSLLEGARA